MTNMPVLDILIDSASRSPSFHGENTVVLHINHCMDNSFYFSEVMKKIFHEVIFIGVPYNDKEVDPGYSFRYYYGKNVRGTYQLYQGDQLFQTVACEFTQATELLLERAVYQDILPMLQNGRQLLIIEDGGYHYSVFRRLAGKYPILIRQTVGSVEQTTSGTMKCIENYKPEDYPYPCTSISRSDIKMYIESRFIGHRVVEELSNFLYHANTFLDFHHVLLIGYGIVGRRVAKDLQGKHCRITVYDTDPRIIEVAQAEGMHTEQEITSRLFSKSTVIIGNVGKPSFTSEMFQAFLEGSARTLYLASSSSQDREFQTFIRMVSGEISLPEGVVLSETVPDQYHTAYCFRYQGKEKTVFLIAQGMPVNFYRKDVISLTYSIIDLIFAEMLSLGLTLCETPSLPRKLYLLGKSEDLFPYTSEKDLMKLWFEKYDLTADDRLQDVLDSHPAGDYLRDRLSRRG